MCHCTLSSSHERPSAGNHVRTNARRASRITSFCPSVLMKKTLRGLSGGPKTALPRGTPGRPAPRAAVSPALASPTTPYSKRRRYDFHQVATELPQLGNATPERSHTTAPHTSVDRARTGIPGLSQPYVEDVPDEDDEDGVDEQAQRELGSKEPVGDGKQGQSNAHKVRLRCILQFCLTMLNPRSPLSS